MAQSSSQGKGGVLAEASPQSSFFTMALVSKLALSSQLHSWKGGSALKALTRYQQLGHC